MTLAHGVGSRQDLPLPFALTLLGAALTLVVTFLLLGLLWREARLDGEEGGRPLPAPLGRALDAPATRWLLRALGLLLAGLFVLSLFFGADSALNPAPYVVYVLVWVGVPIASALLGPVWRLVSPLRTVHLLLSRVIGADPAEGLRPVPAAVGWWPAAVGLFAFVWLELVYPDPASLGSLQVAVLLYTAVVLLGAVLFGSGWIERADPIEVWSGLAARLSVLGRLPGGRLGWRNPLRSLAATPAAPGLVAVVCVLLGSTAYDSFNGIPFWFRFQQESALPREVTGTLGLVGLIAVAALSYTLAVLAAGRLGHAGRGALPRVFAHSVVPIALAYIVAHYFSLLVFEGQTTIRLLSDPLQNGADLFGLGGRVTDYGLVSPGQVAVVQVAAIVVGHVLGVVAAHDRAVALFPRRQALAGQVPLLVVMVGYTLAGLLLLFAA